MRFSLRSFLKIGLIVVMLGTLISCSRVSQTNFERVKPNMTMNDVVMILGEPTSSDSINVAGISGTNAVWKSQDAEINVQFLNEKVIVKTFTKNSHPEKSKEDLPS